VRERHGCERNLSAEKRKTRTVLADQSPQRRNERVVFIVRSREGKKEGVNRGGTNFSFEGEKERRGSAGRPAKGKKASRAGLRLGTCKEKKFSGKASPGTKVLTVK